MKTIVLLLSCVLISCSINQDVKNQGSTSEEVGFPSHFIQDELIIKLVPNFEPTELIHEMEKIGLIHKETIAKTSRLHLFSYDVQKMSPNKILDFVKANPKVEQVEFNKNLELRK